jgi:integrase/recombinase XerD
MKGCRSLTDQEIMDVYNTLKSLRDKAFFWLGVKCGLRISEILSLQIKDIMEYGEVGSQVKVRKNNTKGKIESRTLPLTSSARQILKEYLDSIWKMNPENMLFKSEQSDKAITVRQANRILKEAFNQLKLQGNCSSHSLRKSYAHRVHKALGEKIEKTQIAMGHKSLSSTVSYIQVNREEVDQAILGMG